FNVKDSVHNPNFSLKEVQMLYMEFANENQMKIEQEVIEDIYAQTNGYVKMARLKCKFKNFYRDLFYHRHAALVCLSRRTIENHLIRKLNGERTLSYGIWDHFKLNLLMDEVVQYPTFRSMVQSPLNNKAKTAVKSFRDYLMIDDVKYEIKNIVDTD